MLGSENDVHNLPVWGGRVDKFEQFQNIQLLNTCTIDYFLYFLYLADGFSSSVRLFIKSDMVLNSIIQNIHYKRWSHAKLIWMNYIHPINRSNLCLNIYGSLYDMFLLKFNQLCPSFIKFKCACTTEEHSISEFYYLQPTDDDIPIARPVKRCGFCNTPRTSHLLLGSPILFIEKIKNIKLKDVVCAFKTKELQETYQLRFLICHKENHFTGIIVDGANSKYWCVDDLKKNISEINSRDIHDKDLVVFGYVKLNNNH